MDPAPCKPSSIDPPWGMCRPALLLRPGECGAGGVQASKAAGRGAN